MAKINLILKTIDRTVYGYFVDYLTDTGCHEKKFDTEEEAQAFIGTAIKENPECVLC